MHVDAAHRSLRWLCTSCHPPQGPIDRVIIADARPEDGVSLTACRTLAPSMNQKGDRGDRGGDHNEVQQNQV